MAYRLAAQAVLLLHLAFILFVVAGAALAWRRPWFAALHLPAAAWGCAVELSGAGCPLTGLENYFRQRAGEATYTGDFLEHYLLAAIYPSGLTRNVQYLLGAAVLAINALLYARILLGGRAHIGKTDVPPSKEP